MMFFLSYQHPRKLSMELGGIRNKHMLIAKNYDVGSLVPKSKELGTGDSQYIYDLSTSFDFKDSLQPDALSLQ